MKDFSMPPDSVEVLGKQHRIATDFRDWIRFEALLMDDTIDEREKIRLMLRFYDTRRTEGPTHWGAALKELVKFYRCGADERQVSAKPSGQTERIYDFSQDAPLIYAAFRQAYGMDLFGTRYLHWWCFRALMDGLPDETRLSRVMAIRAADPAAVKGAERERLLRMKKLYALERPSGQLDTPEERARRMERRIRSIRERLKTGGGGDGYAEDREEGHCGI